MTIEPFSLILFFSSRLWIIFMKDKKFILNAFSISSTEMDENCFKLFSVHRIQYYL